MVAKRDDSKNSIKYQMQYCQSPISNTLENILKANSLLSK